MNIGSHLSISGGLHKALVSAAGYGFPTVAMFLRNQQQWAPRPLEESAVATFRETRNRLKITPIVAHSSYLLNLAGEEPTRGKSIAGLVEDLTRCDRLGVEYLVLHPGSCPDEAEGIRRIIDGLDAAMDACPVCVGPGVTLLLETTAGQGNCIGHRFEHLAAILTGVACRERFGVCLDTAHVFAAGYELRTPGGYAETMAAFESCIGREKLHAIHCNDSKKAFGSRVDRHEHIGRGEIGLAGFTNLVNDPRIGEIPLILETPKGTTDDGDDWDDINAATLRSLKKGRR